MTDNKRFHFGYVCGDTGLIDEQVEEDKWFIENCCNVNDLKKNWKIVCNKLNELADENKQLKSELQKMYDVATLNKAIEVLENKYDKMLSDGSDEVKDAMRHTVLRCIEDLDELKDDLTCR